jgi:glycerol-3-phosphate acyltransferase PlsY
MVTKIAPIIAAYLLGSIPFALLVARIYGIADLRREGSGNIGATNVWRVAGPAAAVWVFAGDIGKGVLAMLVARLILDRSGVDPGAHDAVLVACAVAAVLGHVFPLYLGFRGGKGVNTGLGVMIVLLPLPTLIALAVFLIVVSISRFVSLGSIIAAVALPAAVLVQRLAFDVAIADIYLWLTAALALLVLATHRDNIGRLAAGTENRLSFGSRSGGGKSDV